MITVAARLAEVVLVLAHRAHLHVAWPFSSWYLPSCTPRRGACLLLGVALLYGHGQGYHFAAGVLLPDGARVVAVVAVIPPSWSWYLPSAGSLLGHFLRHVADDVGEGAEATAGAAVRSRRGLGAPWGSPSTGPPWSGRSQVELALGAVVVALLAAGAAHLFW